MWQQLAKFVLKFRLPLLVMLVVISGVMTYFTSKVELSYEFARAIPVDNSKYKEYQSFKEKFGDDAGLLVIGIQTDKFFELETFKAFSKLHENLKKLLDVEDVISASSAINLIKNIETEKLNAIPVFPSEIATQQQLDSSKDVFLNLPFYKTLLYNPETNAYLIGVRINKEALNSSRRTGIVNSILQLTNSFTSGTKIKTYVSGLPLIRTLVADRISKEMRWFLLGSLSLSAFIFFNSLTTTGYEFSNVIPLRE